MNKPPDISQKLQDSLIEGLRELGLTDEQVVAFMKEHDEMLQEFLQDILQDANDERAGYCPKCGHSWAAHDTELKGAGGAMRPPYNPNQYEDLYQCSYNMGMGDWCGCEERSRRPAVPANLR